MSDSETYHEGICRLLRGMTGKTEMSFGHSSIQSEWTLSVYFGDAPAWFRGDNWMLPRHAADAIERLQDEITQLRVERDEARRRLCAELLEVEGHPFGWKGARGAEGIAERLGWDCFKEKA